MTDPMHPPARVSAAADVRILKNQFLAAAKAAAESNRKRLENYRIAGIHLLEIKNVVGHRNFGPWLKENCPYSDRMARYWMAFAKTETVSDLEATWKAVCGRDPEPDDNEDKVDTSPAPEAADTSEGEEEAPETPASGAGDGGSGQAAATTPTVPPEPLTDSEGEVIPPHVLPAFEAAKSITATCRQIDAVLKQTEEVAKGPGGRLIRLDSVKQQLKDAKGNLWANRPTHVCPYCHAKKQTCEPCKGEGWVAKHIWQQAPGNKKAEK